MAEPPYSSNAPGPTPDPSADIVTQQACAWFALIFEGSASETQREQWRQWMQADPRHAKAYAELEELWMLSAALPALQPAQPASAGGVSRRRFVQLGMAACTAAVATGAATLWLKGESLSFSDLHTRVGETRTERLADGSVIELAGNTAIDVDFSGTRRRLRMRRGEAYFSVAADTRPLRIDTDAGTVISQHGAFCLSCNASSVELAVSARTARVEIPGQQAELNAAEALTFTRTRLGPIQHAELDQVMAWRSGSLVFFNTPLAKVVQHLQRWREGRIFIADERLAARPVSVILNRHRPEQMLDVLARTLPIQVNRYTDLLAIIRPA
ncbi:FecR family protein [Pseudomonas aegrilactucae]|uniref:FecR domain-containing protein n=1 Tax=Pseudomonas aegrilactucae TaxID=2854028 RepID=A0A9Q3AE73_9PSED|nr:FecR domain-containing protein [Pseudomonas aegrilactucae]MBV6287733.1 FecR domain-containing protein [Pseudomonas aegrilactucae]